MAEVHTYDVEFSGEPGAGLRPYRETVTVIIESESGDEAEFRTYMLRALCEWFDGSSVQTRTEPESLFHELLEALIRIRDARDHHAEHGEYPTGTLAKDQCFDDWAADVADAAIKKAGA